MKRWLAQSQEINQTSKQMWNLLITSPLLDHPKRGTWVRTRKGVKLRSLGVMKGAWASRRDAKIASSILSIKKAFSFHTVNELAVSSGPLQSNLPAKEEIKTATLASACYSAWRGHYEMQCRLHKHHGILWTESPSKETKKSNPHDLLIRKRSHRI